MLAEPRGFCAGVEKAIKALAWMVRVFEPPVYCYHEIVHNQHVVERFRDQGVVFVDDVAEKKRIWEGKVFDYDLAQFWPGGYQAPDFGLLLVTPSRIELTGMMDLMQGKKPLVWRAHK